MRRDDVWAACAATCPTPTHSRPRSPTPPRLPNPRCCWDPGGNLLTCLQTINDIRRCPINISYSRRVRVGVGGGGFALIHQVQGHQTGCEIMVVQLKVKKPRLCDVFFCPIQVLHLRLSPINGCEGLLPPSHPPPCSCAYIRSAHAKVICIGKCTSRMWESEFLSEGSDF